MNISSILGVLILFGSVAILIIYMYCKREKDYKLAMGKYERDMEAYNKAVEMYAGSAASSAPVVTSPASVAAFPAPVVTSSAASSASCGEVLLAGVDDNTAAMVIAILCDELGKSPASLRFHSITALNKED